MPSAVNIVNQSFQAVHVVGQHRSTVVEGVVQCDNRNIRINQLLYQGILIIGADHGNAVKSAVHCMLQIAGVLVPDIAVDKSDIVTAAFRLDAETVQRCGKVLVHKAVILQVDKQDTQVVGPVGLQRTGCGIRRIPHFLYGFKNALSGRFADILLSVEGFADCGDGYTALLCNVLHGNHSAHLQICGT